FQPALGAAATSTSAAGPSRDLGSANLPSLEDAGASLEARPSQPSFTGPFLAVSPLMVPFTPVKVPEAASFLAQPFTAVSVKPMSTKKFRTRIAANFGRER